MLSLSIDLYYYIFRSIAKKLKEYEYKIQRHTKCKEDYLRYIQYEMDLLKLIKQRRDVGICVYIQTVLHKFILYTYKSNRMYSKIYTFLEIWYHSKEVGHRLRYH